MITTTIRGAILAVFGISMFAAGSAYAHEPRVIGGDCNVEVGWQSEPALEDNDNAAVLIIADCGGLPVTAADINVTVRPQRLASAAFNAQVLNNGPIIPMNAIDGFASAQLTPAVNGAYAFIINGTILGRTITNQKFVCGAGSQDPGEAFDCVVNARVFPGNINDRYINN